jgi:hypothetical protein
LICPTPEAEYFCKQGWTETIAADELICPSGKSSAGADGFRNGIATADELR